MTVSVAPVKKATSHIGFVLLILSPDTWIPSPATYGSGGSGVSVSTLLKNVCVNLPLNFKLVTTFGWYIVSVPPVGVIP